MAVDSKSNTTIKNFEHPNQSYPIKSYQVKISIHHISNKIAEPLLGKFKDCPNVEIINGDITKCTADAVASPANSFGFMDGGLDQALTD